MSDDMEAQSMLREEKTGVVVIKISVKSFIARMYCTLMIVFLLVSACDALW